MAIGLASHSDGSSAGPFGSSMPGAEWFLLIRGQMRRCRWPAGSDTVHVGLRQGQATTGTSAFCDRIAMRARSGWAPTAYAFAFYDAKHSIPTCHHRSLPSRAGFSRASSRERNAILAWRRRAALSARRGVVSARRVQPRVNVGGPRARPSGTHISISFHALGGPSPIQGCIRCLIPERDPYWEAGETR